MKVVFALSNPTNSKYRLTRHNIGALFVEKHLRDRLPHQKTSYTFYDQYVFKNQPYTIACISRLPMNLNGKAVASFFQTNMSIQPSALILVQDDLEHKVGNVRIKGGGSSEGHKGVESTYLAMKSSSIPRLQLGIGRPFSHDPETVSKYVLEQFSLEQLKTIEKSFFKAFQLLQQNHYII